MYYLSDENKDSIVSSAFDYSIVKRLKEKGIEIIEENGKKKCEEATRGSLEFLICFSLFTSYSKQGR